MVPFSAEPPRASHYIEYPRAETEMFYHLRHLFLLLYCYQITKRSPPCRFLALGIHCDESANSHTKQATPKFPEQPKLWEDSFALYSKSVYLVFFFVLGQCHLLCE